MSETLAKQVTLARAGAERVLNALYAQNCSRAKNFSKGVLATTCQWQRLASTFRDESIPRSQLHGGDNLYALAMLRTTSGIRFHQCDRVERGYLFPVQQWDYVNGCVAVSDWGMHNLPDDLHHPFVDLASICAQFKFCDPTSRWMSGFSNFDAIGNEYIFYRWSLLQAYEEIVQSKAMTYLTAGLSECHVAPFVRFREILIPIISANDINRALGYLRLHMTVDQDGVNVVRFLYNGGEFVLSKDALLAVLQCNTLDGCKVVAEDYWKSVLRDDKYCPFTSSDAELSMSYER